MNNLNTFPVSDGLGFEEDPHSVPKRLESIRRAAKTLGIELHADFTAIPLLRSKSEASKIYLERFPNANDDHLFTAALALLKGEDPAPHMAAFQLHQSGEAVLQKMMLAQKLIGAQTITQHANSIVRELRKKIVNPAVKKLEALHDKHPDKTWDLNTAIAQQDFKQAEVIKAHQHLAGPLGEAWALRTAIYGEDAFTSDAAILVEPGDFPLGPQTGMATTPKPFELSWWMALIATELELHFPTADEWAAADRENGFEEQREALQEAADNENQVPVVSLMTEDAGSTHHRVNERINQIAYAKADREYDKQLGLLNGEQ